MTKRMNGKVAIVTGGASGIGIAAAELLVAEGARVVVADLQDEKGHALARRASGNVRYIHCDVTREPDIQAAVGLASSAFGGVDILLNSAGTPGSALSLIDMTVEAWDQTFALHVQGQMLTMKHAVPAMKARGGGSIINMGSVAGLLTGYGGFAYAAAKAAVIHMSRCAAAELAADSIRVNVICPGLIVTPIMGLASGMTREEADNSLAKIAEFGAGFQPIPRAGLPGDIAELVLLLASDAGSFITGACVPVDGGITVATSRKGGSVQR